MQVVLFDDSYINNLYPLTLTRPGGKLRIGILTIEEKWKRYFEIVTTLAQDFLQEKFPTDYPTGEKLYINSVACPSPSLLSELKELPKGTVLKNGEKIIAFKTEENLQVDEISTYTVKLQSFESNATFTHINYSWDIFSNNHTELELDFDLLTIGRESEPISSSNRVTGNRIFIEPGASVENSILNAKTGSIYVGNDAEIMDGCMIRGGLALLDHATLKMGAKVYGAATFGPHVKAGGEISNSILIGYSNKGHDGFLGNSVLGEWCNLGADTNNSNLKNNYGTVKAYNYPASDYISTNLQFCGLIMGDHSKSGINTMFNTGTTVGVCANIFGGGFPDKYIPSFSWGGTDGFESFKLEKAFEVAQRMMERRKVAFTKADKKLFRYISEMS